MAGVNPLTLKKMNVLFLTMAKLGSLADRGVYTDLLKKFTLEGHDVFAVCPVERREKRDTNVLKENEGTLLKIRTFNLQKSNIVEKGIGTLAIEYQFLSGIKKYFVGIRFDLIIYSTPPITFSKVISYLKKRDHAYSYLMLKDIFPQNAVDMKMLKEGGLMHQFFLKKEHRLYELSDAIGCMSEANKKYLLAHNPTIDPQKVEVNPNSIAPIATFQTAEEKQIIKEKYGLPLNKMIFVYGGNLGKPQGIDFLLESIEASKNTDAFFLIVGSGTEYNRISKLFQEKQPENAILLSGLPKDDYLMLLNACDVGLLFLHRDFTIPNFPSRLLDYLEMKLPVIAATDPNTDVGSVIEKAKCGYWVLSGDTIGMQNAIAKFCTDESNYLQMRENAWKLLQNEYHVDHSYQLIKSRLEIV